MSRPSYRYNVHGSWVASPARHANGPARADILQSPAVIAALAQIDRAFGKRQEPAQ